MMASPQDKRQRWTSEEDIKLIKSMLKYPDKSWSYIAEQAGLSRSGKSCWERWTNHLNPLVNKENFSQEEDNTIRRLHSHYWNRWATIASELQRLGFQGRTASAVKNRWNNHLDGSTHQNITDPQSCTSHQPDATQVVNIHFQQYSNIPNPSFMVNQAENQITPSQETSEAWMGILEPAQEISDVNMGILEQYQNYFMQGFDFFMVNQVENQITPAQETPAAYMEIFEPDQNYLGEYYNYDPPIPGPGSFSVENELMLTEEATRNGYSFGGDFFEPGSVSLENLWI